VEIGWGSLARVTFAFFFCRTRIRDRNAFFRNPDSSMRLAGWLFLLAGLLLCLSVVWATLGFLMMGIGLIALQAAERRRKRPAKARLESRLDAVAFAPAFAPPSSEPVFREASLVPFKSAETVRWRGLVQNDPEISRLVAILAPHGTGYVEQFASEYLAVNDKHALPEIIDRIIVRARLDAACATPSVEAGPAVEPPTGNTSRAPEPLPASERALAPTMSAEPVIVMPAPQPAETVDAHAPVVAVVPEREMPPAPVPPDVAPVMSEAEISAALFVQTAPVDADALGLHVAEPEAPNADTGESHPSKEEPADADEARSDLSEFVSAESDTLEPDASEFEVSKSDVPEAEVAAAPSSIAGEDASPARVEPIVDLPAPSAPERAAAVAPPDDDFEDLFEKFAPDSGFLTHEPGARKPA
jgi:hypothetical protein